MSRLFFSSALVALALPVCVTAAQAADLGPYQPEPVETYVEPVRIFTWRGLYVGINGGYAWGDSDPIIVTGGVASGALSGIDPDGWILGGTVGYNAQFGRFVLGVEGDFNGGDVSGSSFGFLSGIPATASSDLNWLSTLRARAGITYDRMLFYVTGGVAWADVDYDLVAANGATFSGSDTAVGYALGGGLEWALDTNWTAKAEYLYIDLEDTRIGNAVIPASASFDNALHTIRFGLNYKF